MLIFTENKRRSTGLAATTNPRVAMRSNGLVEATQSEATTGAILGRYMSPLRVFQAIASYLSTNLSSLISALGLYREKLTASRNYYVRTDGSDSNTGLANTSGAAFLTIQKAIDVAAALDLSIYAVTINVASGTYTGAIVLKSYIGVGPITIAGTTVNVSVTSASCISGAAIRGVYAISGLTLTALTTGFNNITVSQGTNLSIGASVVFGSCNISISCTYNAIVNVNANSTISGNRNIHWYTTNGGAINDAGHTITLSGTPPFSQAFAWSQLGGRIVCNGNTFSGSGTGTRFYVETPSQISTGNAGLTYLPGNSAGSAVILSPYF